MTYWELVVREVLNRYQPSATFYYINRHKDDSMERTIQPKKFKNKRKGYALGAKYPGIIFSMQESEVMILALEGNSIKKIAILMKLSPRTVEFYLCKMRLKLNCTNKSELINKVLDSDFLKNKRELTTSEI